MLRAVRASRSGGPSGRSWRAGAGPDRATACAAPSANGSPARDLALGWIASGQATSNGPEQSRSDGADENEAQAAVSGAAATTAVLDGFLDPLGALLADLADQPPAKRLVTLSRRHGAREIIKRVAPAGRRLISRSNPLTSGADPSMPRRQVR